MMLEHVRDDLNFAPSESGPTVGFQLSTGVQISVALLAFRTMTSNAESNCDAAWEFAAPKFHDFTAQEPENASEQAEQWFGTNFNSPVVNAFICLFDPRNPIFGKQKGFKI